MPPSAATDPPEAKARPYGVLGLLLSLVVIQLLAAVLALMAATLALAVLAMQMGLDGALDATRRILSAPPTDPQQAQRLDVAIGIGAYVAETLAILAAAQFRGGRGWGTLVAWRDWQPRRHATLFVVLLVATLVWSVAASLAIEHVYPAAKDWVTAPKETAWVVGFLALAVLFGPIAEEMLFRGWIYTSLRASFGLRAAVIATSVLFALAHWESTHLYALAVFPVGLSLAILRERTGSIAATITFHAIYNGVASVLLFLDR